MLPGRPMGSPIRQNLIEILYFLKEAYGYDLHRIYIQIFSKVTDRAVYYNLSRGVDLGEFKIHGIKTEKGKYSWGTHTERIYYTLGPRARPQVPAKVKAFFDKQKTTKNKTKIKKSKK